MEDLIEYPSKVVGMKEHLYREAKGIGGSSIKDLLESVAHFEMDKVFTESTRKRMDFGTAYHMALLEPDNFKTRYVVANGVPENKDGSPKKSSSEFKGLCANNPGKSILSIPEYNAISQMSDNLFNHSEARKLFSEGDAEVSWFSKDEDTNLLLKGRTDFISETFGYIVDLKTTSDSSKKGIMRTIENFGYALQASHYIRLVKDFTGEDFRYFLVFVQSSAPFLVNVCELSEEYLYWGSNMCQLALKKYADYLSASEDRKVHLRGYDESIISVELPHWKKD